MNNSPLLTKTNPPNWLKILVIVLIGLSIFFRFTNLEQKIYCGDENWTSVAISGHTVAELQQELSQHQATIPITTFDKYQHISSNRDVADTVNYLITSDPQHPPLYYVMVRLWASVFGDSPTGVRSLSVIISLLIFPSVYWLCLELFESPIVAWVAMALIAVSPFQLYFAQEARQYGLWMVEILISSAALLRAIRKENKSNWAVYSLTLILGLYTHLFTVLVIISQGIYLIIQQKFRLTKTLINYLICTIAAFLIFLPWLIVFINHIGTAIALTSGYGIKFTDNPFELIAIFLIRVTRIFFDLNFTVSLTGFGRFTQEGPLYYTLTALIFSYCLISYLLFYFCKNVQNKTYLFVFLLGGFPSLLLMIYDLTFGGFRSIQVRYQLPLYLCLEITVAYLLSFAFQTLQEQTWRSKIAQLMMVLFLFSGLISDVKFFQSQSWWTQLTSTFIMETSHAINDSDNPLLVINNSPVNLGGILAFSHYSPKVPILPVGDTENRLISDDYSQIFFVQNNSNLFRELQQNKNYSMKVMQKIMIGSSIIGGLWEFEKKI
ncbi:MAG: dolichyl-phosphate-mannose--protein mannosyltransferase [Nostocales cyanobacterium W4_Combined_metabat2_030]|nr:dolichyl-phosphate-mannose--protein mannosyltransferase [Nostocales cyanobacterium W4_Combined_metabat2_030]